MFMNGIQSVLTIIMMITIGYLLTHRGWFHEETSNLFSKLVIGISLPLFMFSNLMNTFDKDMLLQSRIGIVIAFGTMIITYGISIILGKILKIDPKRQGVFQGMFSLSNTIFVGLPVNLALFGEKSVPFVLLYYIANTTMFWTIGVYYIRKDYGGEGIFTLHTLKRIFSPPLMGFLVALLFILFKIEPPQFVMDTCKYIGGLTTPLSMFFIGMVIHSVELKDIKFSLDMMMILGGRFLFAPLLVFIAIQYFPVPDLMGKVFILESAMPVMTQMAIVAKAYDSDYKYTTVMASVSTIVSLLFIPLYSLLLNIM